MSLGQEVYERLRDWLVDESFSPNTRLPGENALALQFNVSRPTVRSAIARLCKEGILKVHKGSGTYVQSLPMKLSRFRFDNLANIPDIQAFLEYRCSIEGQIARLAAMRCSKGDLTRIEATADILGKALMAGDDTVEADINFHRSIVEATQNRFFIRTFEAITAQMVISIRLTKDLSTTPRQIRARSSLKEHHAILDAIRNKNGDAACKAMESHLYGGLIRLFGPDKYPSIEQ